MTQPIQEPTTQRQIRASKHGIDQLFRRPCRCCCDDLPYAFIRWDWNANDFFAFPATSGNTYYFEDLLEYAPGTGLSWYTSDPDVLLPDETVGYINRPGYPNDETGVFLSRLYIGWENLSSGYFIAQDWIAQSDIAGGNASETVLDLTTCFLKCIPGGEGSGITAYFQQTSGGPENVLNFSLLVTRLSPHPSPNGVSYP